MVSIDNCRAITRLCKSVFDENPHLLHLMNSVTIGDRSGGYYDRGYRLTFNTSRQNLEADTRNRHDYDNSINSFPTSIHFENVSLKDLLTSAFYGPAYWRDRVTNNLTMYKIITPYQLLYQNGSLSGLGVRIIKDVRTRGALTSFNQVYDIVRHNYLDVTKRITEFYFIGKRNILLGFTTTHGTLTIRLPVILNLIRYNDVVVVKKVIKAAFTAYDKLNVLFQKINVRDVEDHLNAVVLNKVYDSAFLNRDLIPVDKKNKDQINSFKRKVKAIVSEELKNNLKGTIFGLDSRYSYSNLVNDILKSRRQQEKDLVANSFMEGVRFGLKVELLGWRPCTEPPAFISDRRTDDVSSLWWENDVTIIPDTYIHHNIRYLIPEKHRKWKIKKLYINQRGEMYCEHESKDEHPNVSAGRVCTGDLKVNFSDKEGMIKETLDAATRLLEIINYDSPHRYDDLEHLQEVSKPLDLLSEDSASLRKRKIKRNIRTLDFSDGDIDLSDPGEDDWEDEEEEKDEVSEIIRDDDGEVIGLATPTEPESPGDDGDDDINEDLRRGENSVYRHAMQVHLTQRFDPESTANTANYEYIVETETVQLNGETRLHIIVAGEGGEPEPEREIQRPVDNILYLGDEDLLR